MEGLCTVIPKRMEDECMSFMKNYGDQVAEMILIYGTSHGVCAAIHLCLMSPAPTQPQRIVVESQLPLDRYLPQTVTLDRMSQLPQVNDDSRKCVMCEFVITTLDQRLADNATEVIIFCKNKRLLLNTERSHIISICYSRRKSKLKWSIFVRTCREQFKENVRPLWIHMERKSFNTYHKKSIHRIFACGSDCAMPRKFWMVKIHFINTLFTKMAIKK